jgi:integrase
VIVDTDSVLSTKVDNWLLAIEASPFTRRNYVHDLNAYCKFLSKDPDQLLAEAKTEIKQGLLLEERSIFSDVPRFKQHLKSKNLAPNTIRNYIMAVQSFYSYYNIQFPKQRKLESIVLESNIEIPSKSDIQTILKVCDPLEKAIVLLGVSSGLSMNEIINLKVGNFKDGYDPTTGITTLKLRRGKTKVDFVTFLTPESSQAVNDYLEFRNRKSDSADIRKQKQLQKQHVYSNNDFLFIGRTIPNEWLQSRDERLRKFERNSFLKLYRMLNEKANKSTPKGTWNVLRSHNLRKYFNSVMLNAGADSFFVEYVMGHKIDKTKSAYFRASPDKLKEIYLKFVPYLTIQKEADISESPEYLRIKQENQILQTETARHVVERSELQDLRAEMERMKQERASIESVRNEYMQFADLEKIREMKDKLQQELEEISKLKEMMLKVEK